MSVFVYALYSPSSDQIYVGISEDINRRIQEHNYGKSKFTQPHRPWIYFFSEEFENYTKAREREKKLKNNTGKLFLRSKLRAFQSINENLFHISETKTASQDKV
jgi:putative endonuclease